MDYLNPISKYNDCVKDKINKGEKSKFSLSKVLNSYRDEFKTQSNIGNGAFMRK